MRDFMQYWREIRAIQSTLPDFVWLVSLEDAVSRLVGGCIVEVAAALAARLLHAKSHRLATAEEVAGMHAREKQAKLEAAQENLKCRGIAIVEVK